MANIFNKIYIHYCERYEYVSFLIIFIWILHHVVFTWLTYLLSLFGNGDYETHPSICLSVRGKNVEMFNHLWQKWLIWKVGFEVQSEPNF